MDANGFTSDYFASRRGSVAVLAREAGDVLEGAGSGSAR
jgi:hypothetical protein